VTGACKNLSLKPHVKKNDDLRSASHARIAGRRKIGRQWRAAGWGQQWSSATTPETVATAGPASRSAAIVARRFLAQVVVFFDMKRESQKFAC